MDARADMARELTADEAKALFDAGWWKKMDAPEAARLQLHQDRLCMPFSEFRGAMGKLLGRPVFTHEFAGRDALIAEADGKRNAPLSPLYSLAEVVGPERAAQAIARAHKEPPMIDISLSVKSEDAPPEAAEHWDTILPAWAEFDGESAVNAAAEAYFDTEKWDEWFGLDESDTHVLVTVHSPDSIAGVYSVSLDRVTKAYATKN